VTSSEKNIADFNFFSNLAPCKIFGCYGTATASTILLIKQNQESIELTEKSFYSVQRSFIGLY